MSSPQIEELIDLARAQLAHPGNWSLATDARWLRPDEWIEPHYQRRWLPSCGLVLRAH
jgi:hypothetical protein